MDIASVFLGIVGATQSFERALACGDRISETGAGSIKIARK